MMAWTVRSKGIAITNDGEMVFTIVQNLLAAGVLCYGSSNGTSFDNSGSGATNYWVSNTVAITTNAWIRLRFPADMYGVIRELRIQKTGTARRWTFYWSPGPTYFTSGASASAAPTTPTVADMQYVQNGTADFELALTGLNRYFLYVVTGDASEGHSFFVGLRSTNSTSFAKELFLDVLSDRNASDIDPAIYGCGTEATIFGDQVTQHSFNIDTTINNADSNIGGWYKKGTGSAAWVAYPMQGWGYFFSTPSIVMVTNHVRSPDLPQGSNSSWKVQYRRGPAQTFTTEVGYKGKSRLFRHVSDQIGSFKLNSPRTQMCLGQICIPWDGTPYLD